MNDGSVPESPVSPFLIPYLPQFNKLLDDLDLIDGFVLYPVELSGHDLARGLAEWIGSHGRRAHFVAPSTEEDLREIAAALIALRPASGDVVVFAGPPLIDSDAVMPDLAYGLRLLNQRRDSIKRQLGVPLLWCGPRGFLAATAERAPDFWSIRDLGGKLLAPGEHEAWRLPGTLGVPYAPAAVDEEPQRLKALYKEALTQGDVANAAKIALRLVTFLDYRLELKEGLDLCEEILATLGSDERHGLMRVRVLYRKAQLLKTQGAAQEAKSLLENVVIPGFARANRRLSKLRAQQTLADIMGREGDLKGALDLLRRKVLPAAQAEYDAESLTSLQGQIALYSGEMGNWTQAIQALTRDVLPSFQRLGDVRSQAVTLGHLASIYFRAGRLGDAIRVTREEVLPAFETLADQEGQLIQSNNLAAYLFSRGRREDLWEARNLLAHALRLARRHHLTQADEIHALMKQVDERLQQSTDPG